MRQEGADALRNDVQAIAANVREARGRVGRPRDAADAGTVTLKVPADLHARIAKIAHEQRMSIAELLAHLIGDQSAV